jgi:hypothetical protein
MVTLGLAVTLTACGANRTVNEPFPVAQQAAPTPTVDAMVKPTNEVMVKPTSEAMVKPTGETMAHTEVMALGQGSFTRIDGSHWAEGKASIYKLEDGKLVLRLEDFKTNNGPDLYVGLSGNAQPRTSDEVHASGYVELAKLKGLAGNQNYELPADLDLSTFNSVVIYCKAFSVVFSTATLSQ